MNIVFVTNSIPFPSRHGVELPLEQLIKRLCLSHSVDLVITGHSARDREDFEARRANVPEGVGAVHYVHVKRSGRLAVTLADLFGVRPTFECHGQTDPDVLRRIAEKAYDLIWVGPIGGLGLLKMMDRAGHPLRGRVAVGLNDTKYGLYANGLRHLKRGRVYGEWRRIAILLRLPWVFLYERRYLKGVDVVHVQTPLEQRRLDRLFFMGARRPRVICIQNGRNTTIDPAPVTARTGQGVLFMTHLARGRRNESRWFLEKVWPLVLAEKPEAQLWLVGSPPEDRTAFESTLPANVDVMGFVPDLNQVLASAAVAVLPTLHYSGWVNRISDYFSAGLAVVACSEPMHTITGLVPDKHAARADTPEVFAGHVVRLLDDPDAARALAAKGRALSATFPSWDETVAHIERGLEEAVRA